LHSSYTHEFQLRQEFYVTSVSAFQVRLRTALSYPNILYTIHGVHGKTGIFQLLFQTMGAKNVCHEWVKQLPIQFKV